MDGDYPDSGQKNYKRGVLQCIRGPGQSTQQGTVPGSPCLSLSVVLGTGKPCSPLSFSPNMVRKTVKLMGPGASFTMASNSSFLTFMRPGEEEEKVVRGWGRHHLKEARESTTVAPASVDQPVSTWPYQGDLGRHWSLQAIILPLPTPKLLGKQSETL